MSASILPDGSVVFRLPWETVHLDVQRQKIDIHAGPARRAEEAPEAIVASYGFSDLDAIRLFKAADARYRLQLLTKAGRIIELGQIPTEASAMHTAWAVADATRCKIELEVPEVSSLGPTPFSAEHLPQGPAPRRPDTLDEVHISTDEKSDPFEEPTTRLQLARARAAAQWAGGSDPEPDTEPPETLRTLAEEARRRLAGMSEAVTEPPRALPPELRVPTPQRVAHSVPLVALPIPSLNPSGSVVPESVAPQSAAAEELEEAVEDDDTEYRPTTSAEVELRAQSDQRSAGALVSPVESLAALAADLWLQTRAPIPSDGNAATWIRRASELPPAETSEEEDLLGFETPVIHAASGEEPDTWLPSDPRLAPADDFAKDAGPVTRPNLEESPSVSSPWGGNKASSGEASLPAYDQAVDGLGTGVGPRTDPVAKSWGELMPSTPAKGTPTPRRR